MKERENGLRAGECESDMSGSAIVSRETIAARTYRWFYDECSSGLHSILPFQIVSRETIWNHASSRSLNRRLQIAEYRHPPAPHMERF